MKLLIGLIAAIVIVGGTYFFLKKNESETLPPPDATSNVKQTETTTPPPSSEVPAFTPTGKKIAQNYFEYTDADYINAKQAKRPIFLFFYANWCPTCAKQEPVVVDMMNGLTGNQQKIVAFRVNYNDNATSDEERKIADQFGVRYQHTMFVLDGNGVQLEKFLSQKSKEDILKAFAPALQ